MLMRGKGNRAKPWKRDLGSASIPPCSAKGRLAPPRMKFLGQAIECRHIARRIDNKAANDGAADILDSFGIVVLPSHVVERASGENLRSPMSGHMFCDLQALILSRPINLRVRTVAQQRPLASLGLREQPDVARRLRWFTIFPRRGVWLCTLYPFELQV